MTRVKSNKINQLFREAPKEGILTAYWLKQHGISEKLAWWYVSSGWLEHIHKGAYRLAGRNVTPLSSVAALQDQLELELHIGGKTALQLLGLAHYLGLTLNQIHLFSSTSTRLPTWLNHVLPSSIEYRLTSSKLFNDAEVKDTLVKRGFDGVEVTLSCPERAIMEVLHLVKEHHQFEEAFLLMENLLQVRPDVVQLLLENCTSIKIKRLFLYLAKQCNHAWLAKIATDRVSLGKGKRVIAGGGVYDPEYQLSVPLLADRNNKLNEVID